MSDRLSVLLFVILLALLALVGSLWFAEETANQRGMVHAQYPTMLAGADGDVRHGHMLGRIWVFMVLQACLFSGLILLGLRRRGAFPGLKLLSLGILAYLGVITMLVLSYGASIDAGALRPLVLSFPAPTAWMLYGVWTVPAVFIVLYVARFDQWVFSAADQKEFNELVNRSRKQTENSEGS